MMRKILFPLSLVLLCLVSCQAVQIQGETAFVNVTVIPMDSERALANQTVIIHEGRIAHIGPSDDVEVPSSATVIDGAGKFLMPGLAEMHGHIPPPNAPQEFIESVLFMYVANGITTVRGMLGWPDQLTLRDQANAGELLAPNLYLAGPSFNGNSVNSTQEAMDKVRQQKSEGWDLLKIHPGLTRAEYDAMAETAHEVGITFGGHVPQGVGILHAIEKGQLTFDHLDGYLAYLNGAQRLLSPDDFAEVVTKTKEANAWVIPTMALWEVLYGTADLDALTAYPELKYMPPNQVQSWTNSFIQRINSPQYNADAAHNVIENRVRLLRALHEGGVYILMGTDAPQQFSVPGFSLHRELQVMVQAGMSPYEILKSGTANVGTYFKEWDDFGTIAVGKRADLVLVNANPLDNIANISEPAGVMVQGRWLDRAELDERLAAVAALYDD